MGRRPRGGEDGIVLCVLEGFGLRVGVERRGESASWWGGGRTVFVTEIGVGIG